MYSGYQSNEANYNTSLWSIADHLQSALTTTKEHTASGLVPKALKLPGKFCREVNANVNQDCPTLLARGTFKTSNTYGQPRQKGKEGNTFPLTPFLMVSNSRAFPSLSVSPLLTTYTLNEYLRKSSDFEQTEFFRRMASGAEDDEQFFRGFGWRGRLRTDAGEDP
jgi:hypothetical protein